MKILSIETSCDETAVALVDCKGGLKKPQFKVLENIVSSQIAVHRPFGGVVPNLAKREHIKNLPIVLKKIFEVRDDRNDRFDRDDRDDRNARDDKRSDRSARSPIVDLIAVTVGPGLEPALWAGIEFAKDLAKKSDKPLIGANHMEGHLYSNWLARSHAVIARERPKQSHKNLGKIAATLSGSRNDKIKFPAVALVVSGGHTILLKMDSLTKWKKLGETRDDAAGEAFDKVARLLGLPYPGGPEIQKIAKKGNPRAINFPRPMLRDKNYDFSFSGLKTAVLYYLRDHQSQINADGQRKSAFSQRKSADAANIAASFQQAVVDVLVGKTIRAAREYGAESVLLCGGVSANKALRKQLDLRSSNLGLSFHVPDFQYNTDNAAMIAAAAYIQHLRKKRLRLVAQSNLNL